MRRVHSSYSQWLRRVETDYRFESTAVGDGCVLGGSPLILHFPYPVQDPVAFFARLLSGTRPFRLWGLPRRVTDTLLTAVAADLHGGSTLRMDMTPTFMRVYLGSSTCANTVLRLMTNLQQSFNRSIRLTAAGDDVGLLFQSTPDGQE